MELHPNNVNDNDLAKTKLINSTVANELKKRTVNETKKAVADFMNTPIKTGNHHEDEEFMDDENETGIDTDSSDEFGYDLDSSSTNTDEIIGNPADEKTQKILKEIEDADKKDIFSDQGDHWMELGQVVRYEIIRDRKLLVKVDHPYSWEEIQARFGKGHYKIVAKLPAAKNKYLGAQNKTLDTAPTDMIVGKSTIKTDTVGNQNESTKGMSMSELMIFIENKNKEVENARRETEARLEEKTLRLEEKLRTEAREKAEREERFLEKFHSAQVIAKPQDDIATQLVKLAPLITVLAPFFKKEKDNTVIELIKTLSDNTTKSIERSEQNTRDMIQSIQKTIENLNKGKDKGDFDALTVMKMMKDSERDGYERRKEIDELAEEKALARAEERGENDGPKEKDSLSEMLIKGILPALPALMASRGGGGNPAPVASYNQPQVMPPVSRPAPSQASPRPPVVHSTQSPARPSQATSSQRGSLRQNEGASNVGRETGNYSTTRSTTQTGIRSENLPKNQEGLSSIKQHNAGTLEVNVKKESFLNAGLDEAEFSVSAYSHEENFSSSEVVTTTTTSGLDQILALPKDASNMGAINNIVFPIAMADFGDTSATLEGTANKIIAELESSGIILATVIRDFDDETLNAILTEIPSEFHETVKGLHNEIISKILTRY